MFVALLALVVALQTPCWAGPSVLTGSAAFHWIGSAGWAGAGARACCACCTDFFPGRDPDSCRVFLDECRLVQAFWKPWVLLRKAAWVLWGPGATHASCMACVLASVLVIQRHQRAAEPAWTLPSCVWLRPCVFCTCVFIRVLSAVWLIADRAPRGQQKGASGIFALRQTNQMQGCMGGVKRVHVHICDGFAAVVPAQLLRLSGTGSTSACRVVPWRVCSFWLQANGATAHSKHGGVSATHALCSRSCLVLCCHPSDQICQTSFPQACSCAMSQPLAVQHACPGVHPSSWIPHARG